MNQKLQAKLQIISFQMFRDWTANAKQQYPVYDFTIIDETILATDLTTCIQSAVRSLKNEQIRAEREVPGFDIGFILGFIHSNMNVHWHYEYIQKRSNDYKMLMALKALQLYLDVDDIAVIRIDEIYKKILLEDINFDHIYLKPEKEKFSQFGLDVEFNFTGLSENNISISLNNMIIEIIRKLTKPENRDFLPGIENYFSENDVRNFVTEF